jgi:hypothetical protein
MQPTVNSSPANLAATPATRRRIVEAGIKLAYAAPLVVYSFKLTEVRGERISGPR